MVRRLTDLVPDSRDREEVELADHTNRFRQCEAFRKDKKVWIEPNDDGILSELLNTSFDKSPLVVTVKRDCFIPQSNERSAAEASS